MSLEASGVPRSLFILGMLHSQLIQQTSTPLDIVFKELTVASVQCYGEVDGRHYIDLNTIGGLKTRLMQIRGCSEIKGR